MTCDIATKQDIESLETEVKALKDLLNVLVSGMKIPTKVCVEDIARLEGCTSKTIRLKPWLMPNFGEGRRKWDFDEYNKWRAIPEETRHQMFVKHTLQRA